MPATDADVLARLHALEHRLKNHPQLPTIDQYGELTYRQGSVFLSPIEQRLAQALIERIGDVITDDELCTTVWPEGANTQSLRVVVSRLRGRIAPLGLKIECVRDVGYVMKTPIRRHSR
jgi:DNA-binding response OmpR family regulator